MIEYQLPRGIMKYSKCLSYPFLNSWISANLDKVVGNSANGEIVMGGIETLL